MKIVKTDVIFFGFGSTLSWVFVASLSAVSSNKNKPESAYFREYELELPNDCAMSIPLRFGSIPAHAEAVTTIPFGNVNETIDSQ